MALLLSLLMTVSVWADEPGYEQRPDYFTDYYMIVESPDGGIDIYSNAGTGNSKLNNELIPNGTALHIEGEKMGDDNKEWGYTQYHGMYGYVPFDDLKPSTLSEAIQSDYRLGGGEDVDYDVEVNAKEGSAKLYKGPGEKYGNVSGAEEIANGEKLHISQDVETEDGIRWGKTNANGTEGWVSLDDTNYGKNNAGEDAVAMVEKDGSQAEPAVIAEPTATPKPTAAPTAAPKPTTTPKPTSTPKPTATPEPILTPEEEQDSSSDVMAASADGKASDPTATPGEEAKATPTEKPEVTPVKEATPTAEPAKEATPTEDASAVTPAEEPKDTEAPKEEATPTEKGDKAQDASSKEVKSSSAWYKSPVVWSVAGVMLVIVLVLLYFLKKKK